MTTPTSGPQQTPGQYPAGPYPPTGGPQPPSPYPPTPPERKRSAGAAVLLFVGIPLVILALIIGGSVAAVNVLRGTSVNENAQADAGSLVTIDMPNAAIVVSPGSGDQVTVTMRGSYTGTPPRLDVTASGDETEVSGGCPDGWFFVNRCQVRVEVALPADVDVTVRGQNGAIIADELRGDLDLATTNGAIEVEESSGALVLHTTNGRVELDDSRSAEVQAQTTNGTVELSFAAAPEEVTATSTNGQIRIEVPDDGTEYFVDANTTNGNVDTEDVPGDRRANRTITANTTNGAVTIETSD
ncbi:MAG: DUF4097 family beta strand repeat-containing protein [Mycetocola sp.]